MLCKKGYVEAFFKDNGALPKTISQVFGRVCFAEFFLTMDECVFLCGVDTHTEYLVQDRPDSLYL
jgi:uncharacterized protein (DUF362 family)